MTQGNYSGSRGEFDTFVSPGGKTLSGTDPIATESQTTTGDAYAVPSGSTVTDIDNALSTNQVVILQPGTTYTNDGTETVNFSTSTSKTVVAYGATIQVRSNPTVFMPEGSTSGAWDAWYGGVFEGNQGTGQVAFQAEDSMGCEIHPRIIRDCETAVALTNDDLWCEICRVSYIGIANEISLMLLGGDGTPPTGYSVTRTNGGAKSSQSFRHLQYTCYEQLRKETNLNQTTGYGIYMDHASPYTGNMDFTVSMGASRVGWRYHNRMNNCSIKFHAESPGGQTSGGTGFICDANQRWTSQANMRIGGGVGTSVVNNTTEPIMYWDAIQEDAAPYGGRLMKDGNTYLRFYDKNGTPTFHLAGAQQIELSDGTILT